MKRKFLLVVLVLLLISSPSLGQGIGIQIDGELVETPKAPFIENGRTLVPLRVISENLGIEVGWRGPTREVVLKGLDQDVVFTISQNTFTFGKEVKEMEVAPKIIEGTTFVPVRLISELFGKDVDWNPTEKIVIIGESLKTNTFEEAKVVRVVDGDTIIIDRGKGEERLRLILVDTPETKHPNKDVQAFGPEASNFTKNQLENKTVYLEKDVSECDKYNRLLRYVWTERPASNKPTNEELKKHCFNYTLLEKGFARLSTFPPDVKYLDQFRQGQKTAYDNLQGLWQFGDQDLETFIPSNQTSEKILVNPSTNKEFIADTTQGVIKGNKKSKIYHCPGQKDYNNISIENVVYFETEEDAIKAGYKKAKR